MHFNRMKQIEDSLNQVSDLFDKKHWRILLEAGYTPKIIIKQHLWPSILDTHSKKIAELLIEDNFIDDKPIDSIKGWLFCYENDHYRHLGKNAKQVMSERKRQNRKEMPGKDIKKLNDHVNTIMIQSADKIQQNFTYCVLGYYWESQF